MEMQCVGTLPIPASVERRRLAMGWLAGRLAWERTLASLRGDPDVDEAAIARDEAAA